jgi:hypothetical protein
VPLLDDYKFPDLKAARDEDGIQATVLGEASRQRKGETPADKEGDTRTMERCLDEKLVSGEGVDDRAEQVDNTHVVRWNHMG